MTARAKDGGTAYMIAYKNMTAHMCRHKKQKITVKGVFADARNCNNRHRHSDLCENVGADE